MTERYVGWRRPSLNPQDAAIEFNMISGWTPINHHVAYSQTQPEASVTEDFKIVANIAVPAKRERNTKTSTQTSDKTAGEKPQKGIAKTDQGPPTKRKKKAPNHSDNAESQDSEAADAMYGLDQPFPDLDLTSGIFLPLRPLSNDQDELPSIDFFSGSVEAPSACLTSEASHQSAKDENKGWSDSTMVVDFANQSMSSMFPSSDFPSDLEDQRVNDDVDDFGDLDDVDLASLEKLESEATDIQSSSPLQSDGYQAKNQLAHKVTVLTRPSELESESLTDRLSFSPCEARNSIAKPFNIPFVRKPIVRPKFPQPTRDRSPVTGISPSTILRTCFRIGEAINVGFRAIREHKEIVIELFARVKSSEREPGTVKQYFQLIDLYHDRPPHLPAVYDLWKDSAVWERESSLLLEQCEFKMCRCVGRMKKDDQQKLIFTVLSIWEASWKNVDHTKGIICGIAM